MFNKKTLYLIIGIVSVLLIAGGTLTADYYFGPDVINIFNKADKKIEEIEKKDVAKNNNSSSTETFGTNQDLENKKLIEKYYSLIGREEAYAMKFNPTIDFKTYKAQYNYLHTFAYTYDMAKIGNNKYGFKVRVADEITAKKEIYQVEMEVINGKLKTNYSKLLSHEQHGEVKFNDKIKAYIEWNNGSEYVVIENENKKIIADKIIPPIPPEIVHMSDPYLKFGNLEFSPKGNYLIYTTGGWEFAGQDVYDIKNNKILRQFASATWGISGFTEDEQYYYTCNEAGMMDGNVAVFSTQTGNKVRDLEQGKVVNRCLEYNNVAKSLKYELLKDNKIEVYIYYIETDKLVKG